MEVLGGGMLAGGFARAKALAPDAVIFARGVADSACSDAAEFRREATVLLAALADAGRSSRTLVYFSSAGKVYGPTGIPADEAMTPHPETPYGRHKLACEELIRASSADHLILRLPNVVGGHQNRAQLVASLAAQARAGHARLHGHATRDLIHLDDVVDQCVALLAARARGLYNVVSGHSIPVPTLFRAIQERLGTQATVELLPVGVAEVFSNAKLMKTTGVAFPSDYYRTVLARAFA